jgi:hypothetical protein
MMANRRASWVATFSLNETGDQNSMSMRCLSVKQAVKGGGLAPNSAIHS